MDEQRLTTEPRCPFVNCEKDAVMQWPGDDLPAFERVAVHLRRPGQVEETELWTCHDHAGLLSAILRAADREARQRGRETR